MTGSLRHLYLHGFGSGPNSTKGRAVAAHFATLGVDVARLDLRVPSFPRLRPQAMLDVVAGALGAPDDHAVIFGSSLGGWVAARVAERDPRVVALVLLAPAFGLPARWRERAPDDVAAWERTGWLPVTDHTTGTPARVDVGFLHAMEALDRVPPDVRVPTLVVHGRHDDVVPPEASAAWAAARPWVRRVEVDDGHELVPSLPRICAEAAAFLGSLGLLGD